MKQIHQISEKVPLVLGLSIIFAASNLAIGTVSAAEAQPGKNDLAPLQLKLPAPTAKGTPDNLPEGPNVEKFTDKPRPAFMAPKGVKNVALGKKVTASVEKLYTGTLALITDGKKEPDDDQG